MGPRSRCLSHLLDKLLNPVPEILLLGKKTTHVLIGFEILLSSFLWGAKRYKEKLRTPVAEVPAVQGIR
jgi:hypothetical protein